MLDTEELGKPEPAGREAALASECSSIIMKTAERRAYQMGRANLPIPREVATEIENEERRRAAPEPLTPEELVTFREIKSALDGGGIFRGNIWSQDKPGEPCYYEIRVEVTSGSGSEVLRWRSRMPYYDLRDSPSS